MGAWYTFGCVGSVFTPAEGEQVLALDGQMCFSGTAPQLTGGDYATYYGTAIGFDVCGMPDDTSFLPAPMNTWTPESKHTAGECGISLDTISFDITGYLPPDLRVVFKEAGRAENPYLTISSTGRFSGIVSNATVAYDPAALPLNASNVESIHFQVATNELASVSFDFCISNMQIL